MRILIILLALLFISGNAIAGREYSIYESATGRKMSLSDLAAATKRTDVIFFGEFHDDSLIHAIQKDYTDLLFRQNPKQAVSFEMFERDVRPIIDSYLEGKISEEEFLKGSRPWPDYKEYYRPMLEAAKANNSKVIAANVPRKYAAIYSASGREGIEALPPEERKMIAGTINIKEDSYQKNFYRTMMMNMGIDSNTAMTPNQENVLYLYYGAQVVKDETMAESILDFLKENKGRQVIHFNGDFHSNNHLGTVQKLEERDKSLKIAVIAPIYADSGRGTSFVSSMKDAGDYLIVLDEKEKQPMSQAMMGGHLGENYIISHKIRLNIDPMNRSIHGADTFRFKNPVAKTGSVKLLKSLKILYVGSPSGKIDYSLKPDSLYNEIIFKPEGKETSGIVMEYGGEVYNSPDVTLLNRKHSNTPGIVSDRKGEGIYLPGGSWFPQAEKDLADFDISLEISGGQTIVTSGEVVAEQHENGKSTYHIISELPADEFTIVGGNYNVIDTTYDGRHFSIYTLGNNPAAKNYLGASVRYYQDYTKLFGQYPYKSFKIVENFFATGFGMPGYTLLSSRLTAMPWVVLAPGSLAHEFVHNWWGNSIYVDYNSGNWCEALTTFSANYYYNVLAGKPDEALDWRKKSLMALEALPARNLYPVSKFKSQVTTDDAVIGYQKGGFIFYELMKVYGEDSFFNAIRNFAAKNKGKRASWQGLSMQFAEQAARDSIKLPVRRIFNQWLNSTDIPTISIVNGKKNGDTVSFDICQDLKFYMAVPVKIITDKDTLRQVCTIEKERTSFGVKVAGRVRSILLDPDYECLRRLNKWEIPYSFGRTLTDNPLIILPSKNSPDYKVCSDFAALVKESDYISDAKSIDEIKDEDWANRSIIILGDDKANAFYSKMAGHYPAKTDIKGERIRIDGKGFESGGNLLLMNCAHPANEGKLATVIYFNSPVSIEQLRRLFHYQGYSLLLTGQTARPGRPLAQMEIMPAAPEKNKMKLEFEK